ncbi:MAG: NUDIX domain-containing protein [Gammaproteobacteria bacterium]
MNEGQAKITVAAVAHCEGRFLLIEERIRGERVITQPSGRWEVDETLVDTVIRETFEESGHRFTPRAVGGVYFWQHPRRAAPVMRINFIGDAHLCAEPYTLDEGIERYLWLTRAELLASDTPHRNPMVIRTVDDFLAGKEHSLDLAHHAQRDWLGALAPAA